LRCVYIGDSKLLERRFELQGYRETVSPETLRR
jgi:hypothetical protein